MFSIACLFKKCEVAFKQTFLVSVGLDGDPSSTPRWKLFKQHCAAEAIIFLGRISGKHFLWQMENKGGEATAM